MSSSNKRREPGRIKGNPKPWRGGGGGRGHVEQHKKKKKPRPKPICCVGAAVVNGQVKIHRIETVRSAGQNVHNNNNNSPPSLSIGHIVSRG
jgi:hypothetical protein